eukprot:TRINITY_DN1338_c0_g1_i1.p1 TRINITY_DN1338_c0_g1~~TRINITY_DN1338_c0_g1_i1.p1  ORF type:complete len:204 (-),score=13.59 TRINITY_DN1338_c0_g1_i1:1026-1553(-)
MSVPFSPPETMHAGDRDESLPKSVVSSAIRKLNEEVRKRNGLTFGRQQRRRVLEELQRLQSLRSAVEPKLSRVQRSKLDALRARVSDMQSLVATAKATEKQAAGLLQLASQIDVSALPVSFLTKTSPLVGALEETNVLVAQVIVALQTSKAAVGKRTIADVDDSFTIFERLLRKR